MTRIIEKELSFLLTGICFKIHNRRGRFLTEKQYCDGFELELKSSKLNYQREPLLKQGDITIGRPDFVIEDRIIMDFKAKKFITKADYNQMLKYLYLTNKELGLIVNFHSTYLKPKRVVNNRINS